MKLLLLVSLLICLFGCTTLSPISKEYYRVAGKTNKKIMNSLPVLSGGSGGRIPNKILAYAGIFHYREPMTIEQGRKFVLSASKIALDLFNTDEPIQQYLEDIPFTKNNLIIFFYVRPIPGNINNPKEIYCACLVHGKLLYDYYDYDQDRYVTIFEETYEEALLRLQQCEGD